MLQAVNYVVLDAARMGAELGEAQGRNKTHDSLFRGSAEAELTGVAPYLFRYVPHTGFSNWYLTRGWGGAWGISIKSAWPMPEVLRHLQKLLRAKTEDGQRFIFRFYDPRILRVFLPSCDAKQLREFFGEGVLDYCIVEDEDPAYALRFRSENGVLRTERFEVAGIIAELPEPEPLQQGADTDDTVPPVDPALMAALREKYPELETGTEMPPEDTPAEREGVQPEPQVMKPEPAAMQERQPERAETVAQPVKPALKSRWNMFD